MLKIVKNPDNDIYEEVTLLVKSNNGYCPCIPDKTNDTRCICKAFREQQTAGECHCGRFVKVEFKLSCSEVVTLPIEIPPIKVPPITSRLASVPLSELMIKLDLKS